MSEREPMTAAGYEQLKVELQRLRSVERPAITAAIEEARAHGDLSENAEYHAAKEKQSFVEGRIREVESKLALADVIDPKTLSGGKVVFGATVTVEDCGSGETSRYQIVGHDEADIKARKISMKAPLARAMIGKERGEIVSVNLPRRGEKELEILAVEFI